MTLKAKVIIASAAVLLSLGAFTLFIADMTHKRYVKAHQNDKPYLCSEAGMKKSLNETFPSDVMIYGEDIDFKGIVNPRKINDLSEESLLANKNTDHRFLLIVDRENKLDLSVDELKKAKGILMNKDNGFSYYYIGKEGVGKMAEAGLVEKVYGADACAVGSRSYPHEEYNYRMHSEGFWTTKEEAEYKEALETEEYGFLPPDDIGSRDNLLAYSFLYEFATVLESYEIKYLMPQELELNETEENDFPYINEPDYYTDDDPITGNY